MPREHPSVPQRSRSVTLKGALAPGTAVADAGVVREAIPINGQLRGRVRAKLSAAAGTLAFYFLRPDENGDFEVDGTQRFSASNPSDLSLPDTSEAARDLEFYGEGMLEIEYTDDGLGGGSTIEYINVSLL